jgi:hypothetical protein
VQGRFIVTGDTGSGEPLLRKAADSTKRWGQPWGFLRNKLRRLQGCNAQFDRMPFFREAVIMHTRETAAGDFMASLPYVSTPGNILRALEGIKSAAVPERVSQDFVKTILNIPGGSGDQMTSFLKKIGFTAPNGTPTELYRKFRNPSSSRAAVATAIRTAYAPLYQRNEFMHQLSDDKLQGLVVEETGGAADSSAVKFTTSCIKNLKTLASFDAVDEPTPLAPVPAPQHERQEGSGRQKDNGRGSGLGLNLGYTINLNLPATSDPKVFDAIFKSLKEHLLREDDA